MKKKAVVIGAGIVGLATAYQLIQKSREAGNNTTFEITVLEKESEVAAHQTGHNSGVIHSGIYYKPDSLKAQNCLRGYSLLVDFCRTHNINFELCGKVIVATEDRELPTLHMLFERGKQNGLNGMTLLKKEALREHEPHVNGVEGIFVPQTGIIDYKAVAKALRSEIEREGGRVLFGKKVIDIQNGKKSNSRRIVFTPDDSFEADLVINCAGLYSDKVAAMTNQNLNIRIIPFRGEYYKLTEEKKSLVRNLIYPVPDPAFPFLGVHFTRMIGGEVEAGPNAVLAYSREGYTKKDINLTEFSESLSWPGFQKVASKYWRTGMGEFYRSYSKKAFTKALRKLMPEIREKDLIPGPAGVRAQACDRHGGLLDDFMILESKGVVNVCNAPSPAATSSLSIGLTVAEKALEQVG